MAQAFSLPNPLAVLTMRADVGLELMKAVAGLNEIRNRAVKSAGGGGGEKYWSSAGDGTETHSFGSLTELGQMMRSHGMTKEAPAVQRNADGTSTIHCDSMDMLKAVLRPAGPKTE